MTINNYLSFFYLLPEIFLSLSILFYLFLISFFKQSPLYQKIFFNTVFYSLLGTLIIIFFLGASEVCFSNFFFYHTYTTFVLKALILTFSILALGPIIQGYILQKLNSPEFFFFFLCSILSSLLMFSCGDFLILYLLIELQGLCFIVLATFRKNSYFSIQAGLKYFVLTSIFSGFFVFFLSFVYFCLGSLNFQHIHLLLLFPFEDEGINWLLRISLIVICLVFLVKIGTFPFHSWIADIYEGAPLSSTIIFSYLPKLALFDVLIRIIKIFGYVSKDIEFLLVFIGLSSVLIGSFLAFNQERLKKFLIYSSISLTGFPLIVLGLNNEESIYSIYFFIIFYTLLSILSWSSYILCYKLLGNKEIDEDTKPLQITDFAGFRVTCGTFWSLFYIFIFFSVAGLPPLAGFFLKFLIVFELIKNSFFSVGIFLIFFSTISIYYYIKLIKLIFFEKPHFTKHLNNSVFESDSDLFHLSTSTSFILILNSLFFFNPLIAFCKFISINIPF
jgi:NADH-quinone oxidoreductase subunit N